MFYHIEDSMYQDKFYLCKEGDVYYYKKPFSTQCFKIYLGNDVINQKMAELLMSMNIIRNDLKVSTIRDLFTPNHNFEMVHNYHS